MKKITLILSILALALCSFAQNGQNALTQTTLAGAVTGPALYSGTSPTTQTTVCLASVTGLAAPLLPGTPSSIIFVDHEAMGVFGVNTSSNCVFVNRGYLGTTASPHLSGDMVLYGPNYAVTLSQGGNPVPSGLFQQDPAQWSTCNSGVPTQTWVNVMTAAQWICSTVTGGFVPGFNNPLYTVSPGLTTAVASAATILPTGPFFHLTGTTSVVNITTPVGCNATAVGACQFTVICDGVCTWGTGGNIAVAAGTVVAGTQITFTWDAKNSKWVPNVVT